MDNRRLEELKLAYRRTFNTPDGQIVLDDLKKRFAFGTTTFVSGDPHASAFNEGQRAAVLLIARMLSEEKERQ
jgi:hypothetical protein